MDRDPPWWETAGYYAILAATTLWFFVLGTMIGSYLNVVAYRLPMGKNLLWPPSSCPKCNARIRATDNLPVIGWLRLGGRCRDCKAPISPRYPIVEAACGTLFFAFAFVELFSGGANIPVRTVDLYPGVVWNAMYFASDAIALYFFHAVMLSAVFAAALVDHDRLPTPTKSMLGPLAACVAVAVLAYPAFQPVPVGEAVRDPRLSALLQSAAGGVLGYLLGSRLWSVGSETAALALAVVGMFQGWQAAFAVALVAWIVCRIAATVAGGSRPAVGWILFGCTAVHLAFWRKCSEISVLPGPFTLTWVWAGWFWLAVFIFLAQKNLGKEKPASATVEAAV